MLRYIAKAQTAFVGIFSCRTVAGYSVLTSSISFSRAPVSLIWRSPIGVLRFDWAIPLDADDHAPRFSFGVGGAM